MYNITLELHAYDGLTRISFRPLVQRQRCDDSAGSGQHQAVPPPQQCCRCANSDLNAYRNVRRNAGWLLGPSLLHARSQVLSIDDDVIVPCGEVGEAFEAWQRTADQLVGLQS